MGKVDRSMALDYEDQVIFVVYSPIDLNSLGRSDLNVRSIAAWSSVIRYIMRYYIVGT